MEIRPAHVFANALGSVFGRVILCWIVMCLAFPLHVLVLNMGELFIAIITGRVSFTEAGIKWATLGFFFGPVYLGFMVIFSGSGALFTLPVFAWLCFRSYCFIHSEDGAAPLWEILFLASLIPLAYMKANDLIAGLGVCGALGFIAYRARQKSILGLS